MAGNRGIFDLFKGNIDFFVCIERAGELMPSIHHKVVEPVGGFQLKERYRSEKEEIILERFANLAMGKGQNLCLDFGSRNGKRIE